MSQDEAICLFKPHVHTDGVDVEISYFLLFSCFEENDASHSERGEEKYMGLVS